MTKRISIWRQIRYIGFEMIPVVLGVLLALTMENSVQRRQEHRQMQEMLEAISEEQKLNKERIVKLLPKMERTIDSLHYFQSDTTQNLFDIALKMKGYSIPDLSTATLGLGGERLKARLSVRLLTSIAELEVLYRNYDRVAENIPPHFYEHFDDTRSHAKRVTALIFIDILENLEQIQNGMQEFQRALEESKN